ncbi:hypothetical protein CIPOCK429B_24795 [Citrobacter portucalensis]
MTMSYLDMNRYTGLSISEVEHIRQSVRDILVTGGTAGGGCAHADA